MSCAEPEKRPVTEISENLTQEVIMKIFKAAGAIAVSLSFVSTSACGNGVTTQQEAETIEQETVATEQQLADGETVTTEQRLAEIARKVESVESYRVTLTTESEMSKDRKIFDQWTTEEQIVFKKPDKMRKTSNVRGVTTEIYSSGGIMWEYTPSTRTATKIDMNKVQGHGQDSSGLPFTDITNPFKGIPADTIQYVEEKDSSEGLAYVFETDPAGSPGASMLAEKPIMWISADTGLLIKKIIILGTKGRHRAETTYSDVEIKPEIDDSVFEFTPPDGVQVTDVTEDMKKWMEQMPKKQEKQGKKRRKRKRR
jgi:outer membrane lipoprotein carrier protein